MKCATGGKCKVCGELYGELRRIYPMPDAAPHPDAVPDAPVPVDDDAAV
jgi:hypothetical protein